MAMHPVIRAHMNNFAEKYSVSFEEYKQFEAFLNFSIFRIYSAENIDPNELVYEGDDPGVDGVMIFIDDSYISSVEEVEEAMAGRKRDADVTIVFTQAKTSESWSKSEITVLQSAIIDFLSEDVEYPSSEYMKNVKEIFNSLIRFVGKIRDGKPKIDVFFATTARAATDREILAAQRAMKNALDDSGYFIASNVTLVNRDSIVTLWNAAEGQVEATLKILGSAAFPKTLGIDEGYVVTVVAKEFIDQVLKDKNGRLRQQIFEENVRDFLGIEGGVNKEMTETIRDEFKQKRFGILNNGITIISSDVRMGSLEVSIRDFQIVNGCQTSNVLFANRDRIGDDATVMLKIIETSDPTVVDDIVRSTNRQAAVDEDQFLATLDAVKALDRYFEAQGLDDELRLYFERRKNQFSRHEGVKANRVFGIKDIARCVAAMFLDKPEIASRYPNRLTSDLRTHPGSSASCSGLWCQSPQHDADHRHTHEGRGDAAMPLEIAGQASV
ncbi:MAG: AIPR family protein, partial [Alphaproteobacteria bacterium]|nr:AIPR family protein [Alphaproteobacteria bacterium]